MAEGVLFDIATKLLEYLGQSAFQGVSSWWGVKGDLKKLEQTLRLIKARVIDAEKRQEEENSAAIKEWLCRLRAVLYRADDLSDDVFTAELRKQHMQGNMAMKVCLLFSSSSPLLFNIELAREIKSVWQELDAIKADMVGLNLSVCDHREESRFPLARLMSKRETTSFVQPDDVVGRNDDKSAIINILFDPMLAEESVSVIPIVGFGGIGKTTLAQLIFNDEKVKNHFELTKWACVPVVENQREFMGKVFSSFTGNDHHGRSLEELQSRIRESINFKKYLLVLDDIWDESRDRWLHLMSLLKSGSKGSKIIVTTRSDVVAKVVGTVPAYKLGMLTNEVSWKLFKRLALKDGQEEDNPNFTRIGKDIVDRCANVPLAIRVIGSLLYSKDSEQEWLLFRDAHLLKTRIMVENNIMPVLKLSYDFLPSPLKQCFAYCSLFPKDYRFKKTELVHLWMSLGYIEPSKESLSLEDVGDLYFVELFRRNFFQDAYEDTRTNTVSCKMHDLVHDLALHVAGDEDAAEEKTFGEYFVERSVSSSFLTMRKKRSLLNSEIAVSSLSEMIPSFRSIRALSLESFKNKTLPDCIGMLRHLRYLNLRSSKIECLPNVIIKLDCLQTLNLDWCYDLETWPRGFCKLASLRHLGIFGCRFIDMPLGFEKMVSLQELNKFVMGKNNGIDALAALDLRGDLEIKLHRWRRNTVVEARRVNLKDKQRLIRLTLNFKFREVEVTPASSDMELLFGCLMLPSNLIYLKIIDYSGQRFPSWMVQELPCLLPKLVEVDIEDCKSCRQLPHFSQLHHLKFVSLSRLKALEYIEDGWGGDGQGESCSATYFTALEQLFLWDLPELKGWWSRPKVKDDAEAQQEIIPERHEALTSQQLLFFPHLSRVIIHHCPQLVSIPLTRIPRLKELVVAKIHEKLLESLLASLREASSYPSPSSSSVTLSTLKRLEIEDKDNLVSFSINFCSLESLRIHSCKELTSLISISPNSSIRWLHIGFCKSLRNVSDALQHLSALKYLTILRCEELDLWDIRTWPGLRSLLVLRIVLVEKLRVLPSAIGCLRTLRQLHISTLTNMTALPEEIGHLSQLRQLHISRCHKLASLPQSFSGLTSLQLLEIESCQHLVRRCQRPDGEDWPLIQHIPDIKLS